MGISDKSEVKDGAWEFLKLLISDEYQNALGSMCFPIKISSFEKNLSESEKSSVIHRADGTFFKTEDVSETDIEKLRAVINSDLRPFTKDSSINAIIDEELDYLMYQRICNKLKENRFAVFATSYQRKTIHP